MRWDAGRKAVLPTAVGSAAIASFCYLPHPHRAGTMHEPNSRPFGMRVPRPVLGGGQVTPPALLPPTSSLSDGNFVRGRWGTGGPAADAADGVPSGAELAAHVRTQRRLGEAVARVKDATAHSLPWGELTSARFLHEGEL